MQVHNLQLNPILRFYSRFDPTFGLHSHFSLVKNYNHRIAYTRFRCSSHHLAIETGRWRGQDVKNRLCSKCRVIDDEDHFISSCRHGRERSRQLDIKGNE